MHRPAQRLLSFPFAYFLSVLALLTASIPALTQETVPQTAVQASRTPRFSGKLVAPSHTPVRSALRSRGSGSGFGFYDNGPINGNVDAWPINFGFVISDTFTASPGAGTITGMSFGAWLFPGDTVSSVELSITSDANGGVFYFDQVVNVSTSGCVTNMVGFNICTVTGSFNGPTLNAGQYWVNLQNAVTPSGDPIYWDENSGVGCQSSGCPSLATDNEVGTIPSESFTMTGSNPQCFGSSGNLQILHSFDQQQGGNYTGPDGVALDGAGNLLGTTPFGGTHSSGLAYKLSRLAGWVLDPLFNFFGDSSGGDPGPAIVGPNQTLYGGAVGGVQNCGADGSEYCGVVYNLRPKPSVCVTATCGWNENVLYRFTSEMDGAGTINVSASDPQGNFYGTTTAGGAHDKGTVFELSPSGGGWTKTTLYSFTGGNDGSAPNQVLFGNDGNVYGIAGGGAANAGVVFQLSPSGGQWTESSAYVFGLQGTSMPQYLAQDSAGNLYGIATSRGEGAIFSLRKTSSGWTYRQYVVQHDEFDTLNNMTADSAGNLYGTGVSVTTFDSPRCSLKQCYDTYIFKAWYASDGWHYQDLNYMSQTYFGTHGTLALDGSGNLYGVTADCGANNAGTVWQFMP